MNAAMAVSAITHGSHYLVDVLAGFAVAAVCICLSQATLYRASPEAIARRLASTPAEALAGRSF
jgi:membrane-associated phospholipid phosphatase